MILDYLQDKRSAYMDGRFQRAAHAVADHMEKIKDRSPWGCFMTFLASNQLEVANFVYPWSAVGSGDLHLSPRWNEWYGKDLDVRIATRVLSMSDWEYLEADETPSTSAAVSVKPLK